MTALETFDRPATRYTDVVDGDRWQRLRALAKDLAGMRVLHVNSTASGGGVAELLRSLVPLSNDLGVDADWAVMDADERFFEVTKALHNGLQGDGASLSRSMKATYRAVTERNAAAVTEEYDVVVLHDPQSLGMVADLAARFPDTRFVWRCHIDLTTPREAFFAFVDDYVRLVDRIVVSRTEYGRFFDGPVTVIPPAIDPIAEKNRPLESSQARAVREQLDGIPFGGDAPVVTQVSRFDPWKDPTGAVEAHHRLQEHVPDAHLVLAGGMADDDPEGFKVYEHVTDVTADDPNVHLLVDQPDATVNVLQRHSDVVWQKSLREGFGLVVAEALWKRTPVVGADVGGIPLQIDDGKNGYLVDPEDLEAVVASTRRLLADEDHRRQLGLQGRATVLERFLLPRQLLDYLELFADDR